MIWKRYRWWILATALLSAGMTGFVFWLSIDPVKERFDRIRIGMSEDEVRAIMDEPPNLGHHVSWGSEDAYGIWSSWSFPGGQVIKIKFSWEERQMVQEAELIDRTELHPFTKMLRNLRNLF